MSIQLDFNQKSDAELVKLALSKPDNFLYIMKRYEKPLFYYIRRISSFDPEDCEDILQDVFIKVYRNLNGFDTKLKFSSWIYRITHNEVISKFRKSKARPQTVTSEVSEEILDFIKADINFEKEIDNKKLREMINAVLLEMDIKYRDVMVLRYFEEKNYKEISDILRKPEGTVGTLLNRAKKQFNKIYHKKYEQ